MCDLVQGGLAGGRCCYVTICKVAWLGDAVAMCDLVQGGLAEGCCCYV